MSVVFYVFIDDFHFGASSFIEVDDLKISVKTEQDLAMFDGYFIY